MFTDAPPFTDFQTLSVDDVITVVRRLPDKQCASDPPPASLLWENVMLAMFLVELFNRSQPQGTMPTIFRLAYITPLMKKPDLDPAENKSYRLLSNLSVLERLVARQLLDYLYAADLMPDLQTAYRSHHSTETAVLTDIFRAVDHETLLLHLKKSHGISGRAHDWFQSYLSGRFQSVRCGGASSTSTKLVCGVSQGLVLGPIMFLLYTADMLQLVRTHGLDPHLYADVTQVYGFCQPGDCSQLQSLVSDCISDVGRWM